MTDIRKETDSLGEVDVPADKLWGAQTQRSLEHFNIGKDLIPREMITAYAILKKAAANANLAGKRLDQKRHDLIVQVPVVERLLPIGDEYRGCPQREEAPDPGGDAPT